MAWLVDGGDLLGLSSNEQEVPQYHANAQGPELDRTIRFYILLIGTEMWSCIKPVCHVIPLIIISKDIIGNGGVCIRP